MRQLIENIVLLWGWKRYAVAFAAGIASLLALPPIGFFPVLALTFPIFVWLIDGSGLAGGRAGLRALLPAFLIGWWFGFGYFLAGLHWVGAAFLVEKDKFAWAMPFAVLLLPAALALFTGFGTALARLLWSGSPWRVVSLSFGLGLAEVLRGHLFTGFPWNSFGYAATIMLEQMQIVSLIGLYALTILTVFCAASPAVLFDPPEEAGKARKLPAIIAIVLLGAQFYYGHSRLQKPHEVVVSGVQLRLVQPNLTQEERLNPKLYEDIVGRLIRLSEQPAEEQANSRAASPTHIIWPESTLPFLLTSAPQALTRIQAMLQPGQVLIAGLARAEDGGAGAKGQHIFNSIYIINHEGKIIDRYDKRHLVPFGEYLPFQNALDRLGFEPLTRLRGFAPGSRRKLMAPPKTPPFVPLICYEIIFPGEIVEGGERPGWMVNLSDDSWFGRSLGPYQHFHQARVRAVEEGLPVARVTTTGISALIDAYGRVVASLPLGAEGVLDVTLPRALPPTHFSMYSANITFYFLGAFGLLALILRRRPA